MYQMNKAYELLYKEYLREAILLDGPGKKIFKADCNNEYWGHPNEETGFSKTVLWGIAPLLRGDVCMVDTDEKKVAMCKKVYSGLDVEVGDVRDTGFSDSSFDVVLDFSTLDHIPFKDWETAIGEYYRLLKDGGDVLLVEWTNRKDFETKHEVQVYLFQSRYGAVSS